VAHSIPGSGLIDEFQGGLCLSCTTESIEKKDLLLVGIEFEKLMHLI
jgi:hypothetical protein